MAEADSPPRSVDPRSGFDSRTKIFHSLRPSVPLPPLDLPLSAADHAISLLSPSPATSYPDKLAFINSTTGICLSFSEFITQFRNLVTSLQTSTSLSKGDVAFILAPTSLQIPVLYFSLLSLGIVISPANPLSTPTEISHQLNLSRPKIAFATSATASKLSSLPVILLDSPEFLSMMIGTDRRPIAPKIVHQLDPAAILYSSGTTGSVKGVLLTHRNMIAITAGLHGLRQLDGEVPGVSLFTVPLFHVFGLFMCVRAVATEETVVLLEKFDFVSMLKAIETYKVTYMPVSPPLVVAMAKSPEVDKYDLSSLIGVGCGGAPLSKEVTEKFSRRFPNVMVAQGYGLTETCGVVSRTAGPEEIQRYGSTGRLAENLEAKIVDPETGEPLPPGKQGELWLRGPSIMRGYVGDDESTAATLNSEGWLKTGDLCYVDEDGFLYIVDRLKELIKYKAYQVPPAELEALLQSHPEIADAAVIPYPDEEAGQIPMAYVVRQPGSDLNESQIIDYIAKQVAPYKKIRRVAFINAIPKSPAGKILRKELIKHSGTGSLSKL
ncbi:4-coumarate--CoA ligase-like 9 [Aristolochia californica]|uniref:4-coumarate--CoA ligase-like 9 n=1 Tax=Aristolochia californica TaxID=171875 RepID=UPI0035DC74A3